MTVTTPRRTVLAGLSLLPWAGGAWAKATPAPLTVATRSGMVRGRSLDGHRLFTGIPYGKAERFTRPRAAPRWHGVYDATAPAPAAPQIASFAPIAGKQSEDCLHLNIWAPSQARACPVLVYVHGGANETGWSGEDLIAGDRFARDGAICVTVNYRLGALGFLELGELLGPAYAGSGNLAMHDLVLALQWVRDNIAGFGGDPGRVTLAGESAGGKNVGTLMGMPAADGLYSQTAIFSGGAQTVHSMKEAQAFARMFADKLGGADRLLHASTSDILAAQGAARAAWQGNFPFRPVVDGKALPAVPLTRLRLGNGRATPMLIGTNADESRVFLSPALAEKPLGARSLAHETPERMLMLEKSYAEAFPHLSPAELRWRMLTAEEYGMPCLRIAEAHAARGAPVFRYRLSYPAPGGPFKGVSPHVLDVPFTFDHVTSPAAGFLGVSTSDQPMATIMHQALLTFMSQHRPSLPSGPVWRRYGAQDRATMIYDHQLRIEQDPDLAERRIWEG